MKDMTKGSITWNIILFSIPMLLGNVFQQLYNVVDSIIVGRFIGKNALAAVGTSFPIIFLIVALIMGTTLGTTVLISQFFGAKDYKKLRVLIDTTYIILFIMSIIVTIVGLLTSNLFLKLLNTPKEIIKDAKVYLDIIFTGMIALFGYNGISAIMRGIGDSKTPLYLLIISTIVNIILDLLFVVKFKFGIAGAAWATVISEAISFIIGIIILNKNNSILKIKIKNISFSWDLFLHSLKIGIPSGIQQVMVSIGMMVLTKIVNDFGTNVLAAFTAAGRVDSFAMMPAMNFSMALSTFTGQNIGANKIDRVKKGLISTIILTSIYSILISIIIFIFAKQLISLFNKDLIVIKIGCEYLYIVSSFYLAFAIMFAVNGLLRGVGDTFIPMFITLFSLWILRVPSSYFLSKIFGSTGIWWGIPIAWIFGAMMSLIYYSTGKWKNKIAIKKYTSLE